MGLAEYVIAVQNKTPGAAAALWEKVERFVATRAKKRNDYEDAMQEGFIAVVEAAEQFDPEREYGFLHLLDFQLKSRFAALDGRRTSKRDALLYADSIDKPAYNDEDNPPAADFVPDDNATTAFMGVDYSDFLDHCRGTIDAALDAVENGELVRRHYLEGQTLDELGFTSKQAASDAMQRALYRIEVGRYGKALRACLDEFEDYHAIMDAARYNRWIYTHTSKTEAEVLIHNE